MTNSDFHVFPKVVPRITRLGSYLTYAICCPTIDDGSDEFPAVRYHRQVERHDGDSSRIPLTIVLAR